MIIALKHTSSTYFYGMATILTISDCLSWESTEKANLCITSQFAESFQCTPHALRTDASTQQSLQQIFVDANPPSPCVRVRINGRGKFLSSLFFFFKAKVILANALHFLSPTQPLRLLQQLASVFYGINMNFRVSLKYMSFHFDLLYFKVHRNDFDLLWPSFLCTR